MKKLTIVLLAFVVPALAQTQNQAPPASPQSQAQPAAQAGIKRQPQAKTQEEFTAYKQAAGLADAWETLHDADIRAAAVVTGRCTC